MPSKAAPLLLKALVELLEAPSSTVLKRNPARNNIRHLGSCGILASCRAKLPLPSGGVAGSPPCRTFLNLAAPLLARRIEFSESRLLRYTPEQMYNLVACVDQYQQFVPWCKSSKVINRHSGSLRAQLEIGFPPLMERYTSEVMFVPNHQIRAVCTDGSLFSHLETVWRFFPGASSQPDTCNVEFSVLFEFKSLLHSQLATVFFEDVVKQMVSAFEGQAAKLYGPQVAVRDKEEKGALRRMSV
ncbi:coenzyme Q-binding protein COQ10 homolog, mitochondrial [Lepisosteus oculatus]